MKPTLASILFLVVVLASLTSGQLDDLPQCGLECAVSAVLNSTCEAADTPCICANEAIQSQAHACVLAACTVREQLSTLNITNINCGVSPHHDRSWAAPMIVFIVLAGIIFALRIASRLVCHTGFWWDDGLNLVGAICCVAYTAVCFVAGNLGFGTDIWAVPQDNLTPLLQLSYAEYMIYAWCQVTLRASVLLFYIRIFSVGTWPRRVFWSVLIGSSVASVGFYLFNVFQCTPVKHFWLKWDGEHDGNCVSANKVSLSGGIFDLFWTLLILILPMPYIVRLRLPPHKKFAATVMFAWGICTIAIMCYRFKTLEAYDADASDNATVQGIGLALWSGIELDVALICACMPSIYPLFLRMVHRAQKAPSNTEPVPNSTIVTIGGTGGKTSGRPKKRGQWSILDMTIGTARGSQEVGEYNTSSTGLNREFVELDRISAY